MTTSLTLHYLLLGIVSRNAQYKDVYGRTIEIPQRALIFKANWCFKVYNAHLKLASPILGLDALVFTTGIFFWHPTGIINTWLIW